MKSKISFALVLLVLAAIIHAEQSPVGNSNGTKATRNRPVLLTGEVSAFNAQTIFVPPSNSAPVVLRNYVADGQRVKAGERVLRIDTQGAANIEQIKIEMAVASAKAQREVADLEVKVVEAERAFATAEAALGKAKVDAALPKSQISALDFDRYKGEQKRAEFDLEVKQKALASANDAVTRRRSDGELEIKKLEINVAFAKAQLMQSEVLAKQDGIVVHGYNSWRGDRFEEGSSSYPGNNVGQVVGNGELGVKAWALEADRSYLVENQKVTLHFDALPLASVIAHIKKISSAPEQRGNWGNGRYFQLEIELPTNHGLPLAAGMSVLVEPISTSVSASNTAAAVNTKVVAKAAVSDKEVDVEGEIASHVAIAISPPSIENVWQYNLVDLAPEGSSVQAGQMIAVFEAKEVGTQLSNNENQLKEKQTAFEKLKLDHAESERSAELAVSEAESNAIKADRKAMMPKELIRRVDYDKLVIERSLFNRLAELARNQRDAQARARKAELNGLLSDMAQLKNTIDRLKKGEQALTIKASRKGMVLYRNGFNGEKFAIGSQVWMGLSIATLVDPEKLYVNAKVPEARSAALAIGQAASVKVPGANLTLPARITSIGSIYHSKSASEPVIVRDIELQFDREPKNLKPGAAVQVSLLSQERKEAAVTNSVAKVSTK